MGTLKKLPQNFPEGMNQKQYSLNSYFLKYDYQMESEETKKAVKKVDLILNCT
jgi:hypothetical protein